MKLYDVADFIKRLINVVIIIVFLVAGVIYATPFVTNIVKQAQKSTVKEEVPFILEAINFTQDNNLKYDLTDTRILYIGNAQTQWENLENKALKVYEYNFSTLEDIDYLPKAKRVAFANGYDDLNIIDNGEISNKFIWTKNGLQFEINKVNKKMTQFPQNSNLSALKAYLTSGNFITNDSPEAYAKKFLEISGRFTPEEIETLTFEPTFLRFESNFLIEGNNISSELSYLKVFRNLDNFKVVSKRYDFPQIYFYVASLRPEIENSYKNYRYPFFKLNKTDYKTSFDGYQFDLNPLPNVLENQLKTKNFIISEIKINNSNFGYVPNRDSSRIKTISVENFELSYYDNFDETSLNNFVQPIYVFKGSVELETGEKGRITIYTPALNPKYYSVSK